jgi:hypothetical protein
MMNTSCAHHAIRFPRVCVLGQNVLRSEQLVSIHTQLEQNRHIIHDFALTTLSAIPNDFGRLTYIASIRDLSSGCYEHAGLAALYPPAAIQQALKQCHEEVFQRVLETPLALQESDLRNCLQGMDGQFKATVSHWRQMEAYRVLMPEDSPDYLKELFCSNLRALLEILQTETATAR